jgi:hypothetical protein
VNYVPPPAAQLLDQYEELHDLERKLRRNDLIAAVTTAVAVVVCAIVASLPSTPIYLRVGLLAFAGANLFMAGWAYGSARQRRRVFTRLSQQISKLKEAGPDGGHRAR